MATEAEHQGRGQLDLRVGLLTWSWPSRKRKERYPGGGGPRSRLANLAQPASVRLSSSQGCPASWPRAAEKVKKWWAVWTGREGSMDGQCRQGSLVPIQCLPRQLLIADWEGIPHTHLKPRVWAVSPPGGILGQGPRLHRAEPSPLPAAEDTTRVVVQVWAGVTPHCDIRSLGCVSLSPCPPLMSIRAASRSGSPHVHPEWRGNRVGRGLGLPPCTETQHHVRWDRVQNTPAASWARPGRTERARRGCPSHLISPFCQCQGGTAPLPFYGSSIRPPVICVGRRGGGSTGTAVNSMVPKCYRPRGAMPAWR